MKNLRIRTLIPYTLGEKFDFLLYQAEQPSQHLFVQIQKWQHHRIC